jgi:outer membrane lipoprotein-sorting protein
LWFNPEGAPFLAAMKRIANLNDSTHQLSPMRSRIVTACIATCTLTILIVSSRFAFANPVLRKKKIPPPLGEILRQMNDSAKRLKTVSANIEYIKVTVVVDDKSTEYGVLYFQKGKSTEILLNFQKPDPKVILFKKNKAEIYLPKSNQIQEYDLEKQSGLVEQFLLLGFGKETGDLQKAYTIKFIGEEELSGDTAAELELTPRMDNVAAQLTKVQLWISEDSWLPIQQKFFEADGDYLMTRYSEVKVNRELPASTFQIPAPSGAKRVKMR